MPVEDIYQAVSRHLFSEQMNVYAVIDGAASPDLLDRLYDEQIEKRPPFYCLMRGELEPDMAEVAPYLAQLTEGADFTRWLIEQGWGKNWCIFAVTRAKIRDLRQHFRKLLVVYDGSGNPLHFRFYDPRVLRRFLPTCKAEELENLFGPVASYWVEGEDPKQLLQFQFSAGQLSRKAVNSDR